jgi:hypothetical protein
MQRHYRKYIEVAKKETDAVEALGMYQSARTDKAGSPKKHYWVSERSQHRLKLYQWALGENANDPALKACLCKCSVAHFAHLFTRTLSQT